MSVVGIVAEYDPFHTGHAHLISQARAALGGDAAVIAVMSGNWVQRADCAVAGKWTRARLALMGGVDLVLELPTLWAVSSAEPFARGAVELLKAAGIVTHLAFGSECGDIDKLQRVAACLDGPTYRAGLRRFLDEGIPFAACRQAVVEGLLGAGLAALLSRPNNNLGVEYLRALDALGSSIQPMTVKRTGQGHGEAVAFLTPGCPPEEARRLFWERHPILSATSIRHHLTEGEWDLMEPYLPPGGRAVLEAAAVPPPSLGALERAMLARVRTMAAEDWAALPDSGAAEGLPRRLERAGRTAASMEEFFSLAKTKRFTHARLRRLALWALLGLREADRPDHPPYLRVLGCTEAGRALLREMKKRATLPIITKPAHVHGLDDGCRALFALEARCTDLYDLCFETVPAPGREWTTSPVLL